MSTLVEKFLLAAVQHQSAGQSLAGEINSHMLGFGFKEKIVINCNCLACQFYRTNEDFREITDKVIKKMAEKRKTK